MNEGFTLEQTDTHCVVGGTLDFTTARRALDKMSPLVQSGELRQISFDGVTECNSAALALMIEVKGLALRSGHDLVFHDIPEGLQQLAKVCQVDGFIN
ncbi:MAG: STAS domain-containing protein [Granulosicoccus sp.]|nr:STAS domain-containing protein [Granulosicoccus sp.]